MTKKVTIAQCKAALLKNAGQPTLAAKELGITPQAMGQRIKRNPSLRECIDEFERSIIEMARGVVAEAVSKRDKTMVRWMLERRDPAFSSKSEGRLPDDQLAAIITALAGDPVKLAELEVRLKG